VEIGVLGRTNRAFPKVWLRLVSRSDVSPGELVNRALAEETVTDISLNPALWGGQMRGTDSLLMAVGSADIRRATSRAHSGDLIQANLIEILSAIGREWIDFYFLPATEPLSDFQVEGALEALEGAIQEGHIKHLGLACQGTTEAAWSIWRNHDAFEVALLGQNLSESDSNALSNYGNARRVGILWQGNSSPDRTSLIEYAPTEALGRSA
jgi:hypothetical protein